MTASVRDQESLWLLQEGVSRTHWPLHLREGRRPGFQFIRLLDDSGILRPLGNQPLGLDWEQKAKVLTTVFPVWASLAHIDSMGRGRKAE